MRLLVVGVVTTALLVAAAPLAVTQAPRLHSPLLAVVAFGVSVVALVAAVVLLARSVVMHRRAERVAERDDDPLADAVTDPRAGPDRIVLVPTAGRLLVSASGPTAGPRHALVPDQSRQDPSTAGQSPTGESQTQAQPSSAGGVPEPVAEASADRAAEFAARYTSTRSRR